MCVCKAMWEKFANARDSCVALSVGSRRSSALDAFDPSLGCLVFLPASVDFQTAKQ